MKIAKVEKKYFVDDGAKRGPMTMLRVRFHRPEPKLLAQIVDRRLALFDLQGTEQEIKGKGKAVAGELVCPHEIGWIRGFDVHPSGQAIVTGGSDRTLRLWKWENGRPSETPTQRVDAHAGWVESVAYSPDGNRLVTVGADKLAKVWNAADLAPVKTLPGHTTYVDDVAFSPDGKRFVTGGEDGQLIVWDAAALEPQRTIVFGGANSQQGQTPRHSGIHRLAISRDSRWLAAAGGEKLDVYLLDTGEAVASEKAEMDVVFHPSQDALAGGESEMRLWVFEADKLAAPPLGKDGKAQNPKGLPGQMAGSVKRGEWSLGLCFSHDGKLLAVGRSDGTVEMYDVTW